MKMRTRLLRGIVGIEAAIVLIAFVVVAAALAFVALNMGFYTTQRSKEVMAQGLAQASSSLEVDGTVLAKVGTTNQEVICVI
ncbi:MAG: archaellin/type IV pilin N-terminal domain-containing protein, partial [Ignisphaera sp.]